VQWLPPLLWPVEPSSSQTPAHVERRGTQLFEAVCSKDLEGIVAKHLLAPYVSKPQTWFKILNPDYSQKRGRKEMFESFRTPGERVVIPTSLRNFV
jgi:hypothetical protein